MERYMVESMRTLWTVVLHHESLAQHCRAQGQAHVRRTCVGHSLGGAVAVMAGLTWNRQMHGIASRRENSNGAVLPHICVDRVIALVCPPCRLGHDADLSKTTWCRAGVSRQWPSWCPNCSRLQYCPLTMTHCRCYWPPLAWGTSMEQVDPDSPWSTPSTSARLLLILQQWMNQKSQELLDRPHPQQEATETVLLPPGRCNQLETSACLTSGATTASARRVPNSYFNQIYSMHPRRIQRNVRLEHQQQLLPKRPQ
jgi:hypothetical protein